MRPKPHSLIYYFVLAGDHSGSRAACFSLFQGLACSVPRSVPHRKNKPRKPIWGGAFIFLLVVRPVPHSLFMPYYHVTQHNTAFAGLGFIGCGFTCLNV